MYGRVSTAARFFLLSLSLGGTAVAIAEENQLNPIERAAGWKLLFRWENAARLARVGKGSGFPLDGQQRRHSQDSRGRDPADARRAACGRR